MLVFVKGGKPEHPGKTFGARRELTTNASHTWHWAGKECQKISRIICSSQ